MNNPGLTHPLSFNNKLSTSRHAEQTTLARASLIGDTVEIAANGNIRITAAEILGTHGVQLRSELGTLVEAGHETQATTRTHRRSKIGFFTNKDGDIIADIGIGPIKKTADTNTAASTPAGSRIESSAGTVAIAGTGAPSFSAAQSLPPATSCWAKAQA